VKYRALSTAVLAFGDSMKHILKVIIEAGVRPEMSVRKARFVKACNLIAIISAVWLIGVLPMFRQGAKRNIYTRIELFGL
jgi:hypothetical protein